MLTLTFNFVLFPASIA